jgi:hypothetical protein
MVEAQGMTCSSLHHTVLKPVKHKLAMPTWQPSLITSWRSSLCPPQIVANSRHLMVYILGVKCKQLCTDTGRYSCNIRKGI